MANVGLLTNNPGNLTVTGPNSFLYPGQSGVYASSNGLYYAQFPDAATGSAALQTYIANNIGTDASTSENTLSSFLGYFLNGNSNGVSNTNANPYATSYLNNVSSATGLSASQQFTASQVSSPSFINSLASAISTNEGTSSIYTNGGTSSAQSSVGGSSSNSLFGELSQAFNNAQTAWFTNTDGTTPTQAESVPNAANASVSSMASGMFGPLISFINTQISGFESGIEPFLVRSGFGVVGIVLVIGGIIFLLASNKTVQQVAVKGAEVAAV